MAETVRFGVRDLDAKEIKTKIHKLTLNTCDKVEMRINGKVIGSISNGRCEDLRADVVIRYHSKADKVKFKRTHGC